MNNPFFSIIVPVFKVKREYLTECVESLINQTYQDIEIILVDDGSPDDCGKYCDEFAASDSRIRVIHQVNSGVSAARNNGIKQARGEWILFADSDDWLELNACDVIRSYLTDTDADIVEYGMYKNYVNRQIEMNRDIGPKDEYHSDNPDDKLYLYRKTIQPPKFAKNSLATGTSYYSCNKAIRTSFLKENKIEYPQGIPFSEDKVFFLRCLLHLHKIKYIDDCLYHYRQNAESASYKYSENADTARIALLKILHTQVDEMIQELESDLPNASKQLNEDLDNFIMMISTSVISKKFYHKDWAHGNNKRRAGAKAFLAEPIIKKAFDNAHVRTLTPKNALRVWLIKHNMFRSFMLLFRLGNRVRGTVAQH